MKSTTEKFLNLVVPVTFTLSTGITIMSNKFDSLLTVSFIMWSILLLSIYVMIMHKRGQRLKRVH
ncbi:Uncharacterised protein [uncultured archaeon]|nr:Uncharacterised protein [uncultured archaeon]